MQDAPANVYGSMACSLLPRHSIPVHIWKLVAAVGVVMLVGSLSAEDAASVIADASRAMGVVGVNSVTLAGTAVYGNFGQSRTLSFGLAFTTIGNYNRTFDFARGISHSTGVAAPPGAPNGVSPGPFDDLITPASPGIKRLEIWTTPWGFLLGAAAASKLTLKTQTVDKVRYRVVSYTTPFGASSGRPYTIAGYISPQMTVDKVETWIDHPLMGDLEVMFNYGNYQDAAGLKVPTKVSQKNIGMEVYVARFAFAAANPPDLEALLQPTVPDVAAAPLPMLSKPLAAGVYLISGGYDALVVELKDSVVILGGGGNEARGLALIAEARRLVPGKPITYAVNLHGHFDHAMVLPAFASAGITILTDDPNQYFLQESLNTPRTLVGDAFAKSKQHAKVESVIEKRVLGDAARSIELHHLKQIPHADGMLAAWLPKERILFVSDIEPPIAGQPLTPSMVALQQNIDRLGLDFETFISNGPRSTPPLSRSEFMARLSQAARAGER
jgi:glyoxylase-like metal-dependent hydrolase (beta-lactamase superfamily II)